MVPEKLASSASPSPMIESEMSKRAATQMDKKMNQGVDEMKNTISSLM